MLCTFSIDFLKEMMIYNKIWYFVCDKTNLLVSNNSVYEHLTF